MTDTELLENEEPLNLAEFAQLNEGRAATYALLARLYSKEVDAEFLDQLKGMRLPVSTGNAKWDEGNRLMAKFLSNTWANTVLELAQEYVRIFIGHGNDAYAAAYPYESVYTSEKRLMMQDARDEVLAIYRSYGMEKGPQFKDCEDHIGLECTFMQVLCQRAAEALASGEEEKGFSLMLAQRNFLDDHLLSWSPMLTKDIRHYAKTDLYKGLASMTDGFFAADFELLNEMFAEEEE